MSGNPPSLLHPPLHVGLPQEGLVSECAVVWGGKGEKNLLNTLLSGIANASHRGH